ARILDAHPPGPRAGRHRGGQRYARPRLRSRRHRVPGRPCRPPDRRSDDQSRAGERASPGRRRLRDRDRDPLLRSAFPQRDEHRPPAHAVRGIPDDHRDLRARLLFRRLRRSRPALLPRALERGAKVPVRPGAEGPDPERHRDLARFIRAAFRSRKLSMAAGKPAAGVRPPPARSGLRRFWSNLGPGIITGAADDDPSGIATYSIAGAQFGTALLWTAWLTWPLMAAVQMTCARIGMVAGRGLAGALRQKYPRWVLAALATALFVANTINVGADLAGMADAAEMLTGWNSHFFVVIFGGGIAWA